MVLRYWKLFVIRVLLVDVGCMNFLLCSKAISKHGRFCKKMMIFFTLSQLSPKTGILPHLHAFTQSEFPKVNPTTLFV